jgi:hypothetical protein
MRTVEILANQGLGIFPCKRLIDDTSWVKVEDNHGGFRFITREDAESAWPFLLCWDGNAGFTLERSAVDESLLVSSDGLAVNADEFLTKLSECPSFIEGNVQDPTQYELLSSYKYLSTLCRYPENGYSKPCWVD